MGKFYILKGCFMIWFFISVDKENRIFKGKFIRIFGIFKNRYVFSCMVFRIGWCKNFIFYSDMKNIIVKFVIFILR